MNFKDQAIDFFVSHTDYQKNDVVKLIPIHDGYTNISFKAITSDHKAYQIRLNNTDSVDRINEKNVLDIVKFPYFIYFDIKTGNAIKQWIDGVNPRKIDNLFIKNFVNEVQKLHNVKVNKKVLVHDYLDCLDKAQLTTKHKSKYLELITKYRDMPLVLSHNDLSTANLLVCDNHKIIFIDYEWSRLNNEYWDAANFIREAYLTKKQIEFLVSCNPRWNTEILNDMIYICTNYAYQWTFNMPNSPKMIKCQKMNLNKMNKYYELFFVTNRR